MKKGYLLTGICLFAMFSFLTSCGDKDLFDQEAWNEEMKQSFPVTDIQTNWQTVGTATANVTVDKDAGSTYTIKVYDADPIFDSANLLSKTTMESGSTSSVKFNYALADSLVYVACVDSHNRREVVPVRNVTDGSSFDVSFGAVTGSRAATSRASLTIDEVQCPYTEEQIAGFLKGSSAHQITEGENVAYWETAQKSYQNFYINSTITTIYGTNSGDFTAQRLIIAKGGTWKLSGSLSVKHGVEIIVADGGKIDLNGCELNSLMYNGYYAIIVMPGGQITGSTSSRIYENNGGSMYNNGTVNVPLLWWTSGGTIYNGKKGSMDVDAVTMTKSYAAYFVNYSPNCHIGDMSSATDNYSIKNTCKMIVDKTIEPMIIEIADGGSLQCGTLTMHNCSIKLGSASILKANTSNYQYFWMEGPTSGTPAIFEAGDISSAYYGSALFYYKLYVDVTSHPDAPYSWSWYNQYVYYGYGATAVAHGEADETIPQGDCSIGYTSKNGPQPDDKDFNMTYCFEDNYPKAGDYDFNDAVFDVTRTLNGNVVTLAVKLRAVGASVKLGAAIRLSGITSGITSIATDDGFGNASTSYEQGLNNSGIVIPLFSDAHQVLTGSTNRKFVNTLKSGENAATADAKAMNITITCASADVAANINFGNIDPYITNDSFEIHTYAWRDNAAISNVANLAAGKYVWAIAVPNSFKYPLEYQSISGAYSKFDNWAKNQNNSNWYDKYNSKLVY